MENRIRELVKAKGLRMSDLANRCGMTQSNLVASLKKNPKLSTLEDIANALGVRVSDIIDPEKEINAAGLLLINGQTYVLSKPSPQVVQIPTYNDYGALREALKRFIATAIDKDQDKAICGVVEAMEYFNLYYDANNERFNLNLCYGLGQMWQAYYDKESYGDAVSWDMALLCQDIINDVEGVVLMKFGTKAQSNSSTQEIIDAMSGV